MRDVLIVLGVVGLFLSVTAYNGDSIASPARPPAKNHQVNKATPRIPEPTADQPVSDPQKQAPPEPVFRQERSVSVKVLPEIIEYISKHANYGEIISAEEVDTSRKITRQRVYTTVGIYTFNLMDGKIVGLKDENPKPEPPPPSPPPQPPTKKPLKIGMSQEEVRATLGEPTRINQYIRESGTSETWYYGDDDLSFDNGKLTDITIHKE